MTSKKQNYYSSFDQGNLVNTTISKTFACLKQVKTLTWRFQLNTFVLSFYPKISIKQKMKTMNI